jgi:hypothetical protein
MLIILLGSKKMDENIAVIRISGQGMGCCNHVVSSCHIFVADSGEELQEQLKTSLLEWLWGKEDNQMTKEQFELAKKDEIRIIDFIEGGSNIVEVETYSEQWENLNSYCEFTQIEDRTSTVEEDISYNEYMTAGRKAAITKKAIKEGKNPVMVHAGHKAVFTRRSNKKK